MSSRAPADVPATSSISVTAFCRRRRSSTSRHLRATCIRKRGARGALHAISHESTKCCTFEFRVFVLSWRSRERHGGPAPLRRTTGVLLMAHGTPPTVDDLPEYLTLVRGGRPPSPELLAEMRHNYEAIGGRSPLTAITEAQAEALRTRLGGEIPVAFGMRNWRPFIADALEELAAAGAARVVGVPMA